MAETAAVCPHLHFPLQSGSDAVLAAMHRGYTADRYLARLAEARRVIDDLAVSTDIIVGFPGETEEDFAATLAVAAEARFDDAFTFIFSPRPGNRGGRPDRSVRRPRRRRRALRPAARRRRAVGAGRQRRSGRADRGGARRGPEQEGPGGARRPHTAPSPRPLRPPSPMRPGAYASVEITGAAPHHLTGRFVEQSRRRPATACGSPSSPAESMQPPVVVLGPTASGKSEVAMAAARAVAGTEIVAVDAMQVYRGMDVGTAKPTPADRATVVHHCLDLVEPTESFSVTDYQRAYDAAIGTIHGRPLLVAGTGLYLVAVIDRLEVPGTVARRAGRARGRRRRPLRPPAPARPRRRQPHRTDQRATRRAGAGGHDRLRTSVQLVRSRRRLPPADGRSDDRVALVPAGAGATDRGSGCTR